MNLSVMYWKWDNDVLDLSVLDRKIDDLTARTQIGTFFIGTQWIEDYFHGDKIGAAFRRVVERLHGLGRKAVLEGCIRNEGEPFYRQYPGEPSYLLSFYEGEADENGCGTFRIPHEPVWHYWRKSGDHGEHKVFCAYRLKKTGAFTYREAVRCDKTVTSKAVKSGDHWEVEISFTGAQAGETVAVCVGFPQPIVDLAHPKLIPYFRGMAERAKELGADGLFSDEWGYDMILKIVQPNPYDDTQLNLRHVSYSEYFEEKYRNYNGVPLFENLLSLYYKAEGDEKKSVQTVNAYLKTMRLICTENDKQMYDVVKEILGHDAFWGVHPTWWGSVDSLNFEFFKNGLYWWDAERDYAQTDETILYAIRTAMAHRFSSPIWYNMWYSMGTRDINTYYDETWRNLRCGGRTHYLGYECPNEAVVLELKPQGMLESIEELDKRVRLFDGVSKTQPDCRLLVLFGYEAVSNWAEIGMDMPWKPQNPRFDCVLNTVNGIFQQVLCDLVPSYAAENGSLSINEKGKLQYGTQEYDGAIVLYPDGMAKEANELLLKADASKLAVCGAGEDSVLARSLRHRGATVFTEIPAAETLAALATELFGVPANRWKLGSVMQDGSLQFATDGRLPAGNPMKLDFEHGGKRISFEGCDALWLSPDLSRAIFPEGKLTVDGKQILSSEVIK